MKKNILTAGVLISACLCLSTLQAGAQSAYQYHVDLTKVIDDKLQVELVAPAISKNEISFYLPKIVPGTYMNSNYGMYVHDLKAFDKENKELPVSRQGGCQWTIKKAKKIHRLSYTVEDTWDAAIENFVYSMCGTSFEAGKNFVLNTPGVFGYFDGMKKMPFEISFTKPAGFYAATGLKPVATGAVNDKFICSNADHLYDSPIMYSLPDTTTITVGNAEVLVAVYAPRKQATSKFIAANLDKLLQGSKDYLGGKLPVDKYAFIFYFNSEQKKQAVTGAWEHSYSSFYSLDESPEKDAIEGIVDISSHEFFHIISPLTISSREVKEFNFNETVLSKHLWLYEGSTEYTSHHVQVWSGMKTPEQFLETLAQKINGSRSFYNDSLSFTELSTESAGRWAQQYGNVYQKGALISACLDLYLLKLSNAQYGIKDLKHDLSIKYGKDKFFEDAELFDIITEMTFPQVKDFFKTYVEKGTPIPYQQFFDMAGVDYIPAEIYRDFTIGGVKISSDKQGAVVVGLKGMNAFGEKLGYKEGDEMVSINDMPVNISNISDVITQLYGNLKEGDIVTVKVKRTDASGKIELVTLSAAAFKIEKTRKHLLRFISNPTAAQLKIRNAWLHNYAAATPAANAADVAEIDGIIKALYDVISGPAGPRNWDRFRSLFHKDAYMAAFNAKKELRKFSPAQYVQNNGPFFMKNSFNEKEIGRTVNQFGTVAQVFTAYEFNAGTTPPTTKRGINSVELIKEKGRWFIMSVTWDEETKEQPIPPAYLNK
ncbi:MAG: peptidase M61 [Ferruginibacter sp.]|nr:peptidase M61 [Ferruginibacter sp.]